MSVARKARRLLQREGLTPGDKMAFRGKAFKIDPVSGMPTPTVTTRSQLQARLNRRMYGT